MVMLILVTVTPDYGFGDALGTNNVTLTTQQLPVHTHSATALSTLNPSTHTHKMFAAGSND